MKYRTKRVIVYSLIALLFFVIAVLLIDKYLCCFGEVNIREDSNVVRDFVFSPDMEQAAFIAGEYSYRLGDGFVASTNPYARKICYNGAGVYLYTLANKEVTLLNEIELDEATLITDYALLSWDNVGVVLRKSVKDGSEEFYITKEGVKIIDKGQADVMEQHKEQYVYSYEHDGADITRWLADDRLTFVERSVSDEEVDYYLYKSQTEIPRKAELVDGKVNFIAGAEKLFTNEVAANLENIGGKKKKAPFGLWC